MFNFGDSVERETVDEVSSTVGFVADLSTADFVAVCVRALDHNLPIAKSFLSFL